MELKEIIEFFKKNYKLILITTILSGLVGLAGYFLIPKKYVAKGSLFIRRSIYPFAEDHFTYEGYYGQQAAMAYANSFIALIESEDMVVFSLKTMEIEVNDVNIRKYAKKIDTVKSGPQLVELIVKDKSKDKASELWHAVANTSMATLNNLSRQNDPFVGVIKISNDPNVIQTYRTIPLCVGMGVGFGFLISIVISVLKEVFKDYLPKKKRKLFKK